MRIERRVPSFEGGTSLWYGAVAPRATPHEIVDQLNAVLADPHLQVRFANLGGAPMPTTPTQFGKLIVEDTEKWAKVIKFLTPGPSEPAVQSRSLFHCCASTTCRGPFHILVTGGRLRLRQHHDPLHEVSGSLSCATRCLTGEI